MKSFGESNSLEENRFKTISDFKWCINRGGEINFIWKEIDYGISHSRGEIIAYIWNKPETTECFDTVDDVLEYIVSGDRLRDVITQVTVLDRTI